MGGWAEACLGQGMALAEGIAPMHPSQVTLQVARHETTHSHLVGGEVGADHRNFAAVHRKLNRHGALVAAHAQHAARHAGSGDLAGGEGGGGVRMEVSRQGWVANVHGSHWHCRTGQQRHCCWHLQQAKLCGMRLPPTSPMSSRRWLRANTMTSMPLQRWIG